MRNGSARVQSTPRQAVLITAGLLLGANSIAQTTYICQGVPVGVAMGTTGTLVVQSLGGLNWAYLCGVNSNDNGIAPAACKSLYALLLTAQSSGRSVTLWFTNAAGSCGANTPWAYADNLYFWRIDG
jgi:hypothetical protein